MNNGDKRVINRDILENSYYLINLFVENKAKDKQNISITNLKLQKLMYFIEAYYMVENPSEDEFFSCPWSAWDYGPVNKVLYINYKKFGSMEISLSAEEMSIGENLPEINKKYIKRIYDLFGHFSAFDLVTLTHLNDSPWDKIYKSNKTNNKYDFDKLNDSVIPKKETRDWFKVQFNFLFKKGEEK